LSGGFNWCTSPAHGQEQKRSPDNAAREVHASKEVKEQWFDLKFVGQHIIDEKKEIGLTPEKFLTLLQKGTYKLQPNWLDRLGQPVEPSLQAQKILKAFSNG
jgi:hypothetical protein